MRTEEREEKENGCRREVEKGGTGPWRGRSHRRRVLAARLSAENAEAITCFPSVLRADRSVPNIQNRRLTVGKQTYEEILQRTNDPSFHLSLTTMLGGEIRRQEGETAKKNTPKKQTKVEE